MGRKSREKKQRKQIQQDGIDTPAASMSWQDAEGVHLVTPGTPPTAEQIEEITRMYQENIRNSPIWDYWLMEYGPEKADELLNECQFKVKPVF
jgi:hypothetical protein